MTFGLITQFIREISKEGLEALHESIHFAISQILYKASYIKPFLSSVTGV